MVVSRRELKLSAGTERLSEVRSFVREAVAELGGTPRDVDDLVQAVDEATCNVMIHGYRGKPGEIELQAERLGERIEIRILDRAPVFDPTAMAPVDPANPPASNKKGHMGVGIHLARTMTDGLRHHVRPGGGNELTLVRSIEGRGEED